MRADAGFSVVLAVMTILILLVLGLALVTLVVEDSDLSLNHVQANQAYYAAHAGLEYGIVKLATNPTWTGLPSPGKAVGAGSFWVAPPDTIDATGTPLPAGQKRLIATGVVGGATRSLQVHVSTGTVTTYAGDGTQGYLGDGGVATAARMRSPEGVAVAGNGDVYIADTDNHVIRRVAYVTGVITTVAGNGSPGSTGDGGPATSARLSNPQDVFVDGSGDFYIADTGNHKIRKVTAATGTISTVAGTGSPGSLGDGGLATLARLNSPRGIAVAGNGDLFIGDRTNNKIRLVVAATGIIFTFAGTGTAGYLGDGGLALLARLQNPEGVALASNGDLYVADTGNHAVRRVSAATGIISTVAGTGTAGSTGDGGPATSARLSGPQAIDLNSSGDLFIADSGNHKIRRLESASGLITTVAGTGTSGFSGDGGATTLAQFDSPRGVAISSSGAYYVGDRNNHRVRKISGLLSVVAWIETRT